MNTILCCHIGPKLCLQKFGAVDVPFGINSDSCMLHFIWFTNGGATKSKCSGLINIKSHSKIFKDVAPSLGVCKVTLGEYARFTIAEDVIVDNCVGYVV